MKNIEELTEEELHRLSDSLRRRAGNLSQDMKATIEALMAIENEITYRALQKGKPTTSTTSNALK